MSNQLLTIGQITKEALRLWRNYNSFLQQIPTQYDNQFARDGAKIGSQLRIRLPVDFTVRSGSAAEFQDVSEQFTTLTLANMNGVDMAFPSSDMTLSVDDFGDRYLAPAINNLVGFVAVGVMAGAEGGVSNYIDNETAGAIITPTLTTVMTAGAILDNKSTGSTNRRLVVSPMTDARMASAMAGLFNPVATISDQNRSGAVKNIGGFDWMKDQTVINHTSGTFTAGTVSGANQTGSTIVTSAITGSLNKGDIITFALVNGVNHVTKGTYGGLGQFVVTQTAASGSTSINIYPPIIPGGAGGAQVQYQTVDVSPASGATILLASPANVTYRKNIAFVPEAVTMVTADLVIPPDVKASRQLYDGVSMRMVQQYLISTDVTGTRLDILWGSLWLRPEWAVVVADITP